MEFEINDHRKIHAIEEEFSNMFPHLKIEFFARPGKVGGSHPDKVVHYGSKTLGEVRNVHNKGKISIKPSMTSDELTQNFSDVYGLSARILKKSGNSWEPVSGNEILGRGQ